MSVAFLNGEFVKLSEARISPLDRGFLFGDGVYEVIPAYAGKTVGLRPHLARLNNGLAALEITTGWDDAHWQQTIDGLLAQNPVGNWGVYIQVSRGADVTRFHAYPKDVSPTIFMFVFPIAMPPSESPQTVKGLQVVSAEDLRWQRCHIKSTSLLGNVMHFQQAVTQGGNDTLLYDNQGNLTEFSSANVFVVQGNVISTPALDNHILPGITRLMLLDMLRKQNKYQVVEGPIGLQQARTADEIWLTSSSKEVSPVLKLDGRNVGDGLPGKVWQDVIALYGQHKYDY